MVRADNSRFRPNWLTWAIDRETRQFRVYVVEPRENRPREHADIFWAALSLFLSGPAEDYHLGSSGQRPEARKSRVKRFDLLAFPEAFLPSQALIDVVSALSRGPACLGCVHVGLRPLADSGSHLFSTQQLYTLLDGLRRTPVVFGEDLVPFSAWLDEQGLDDRFNVGCLFAIDPESRLRVCLHPKLVKSRFEESPNHDRTMKEANLLSLVTLRPTNKDYSTVTIQPLICSDVLKLGTDRPNNHPIDAITSHRSCFPEVFSDDVDVVSVATWSPNTPRETAGERHFSWHHLFRKAFARAAQDDDCLRHRHAAFVLSNFGLFPGRTNSMPCGLSGVFLPLPVYGEPFDEHVSKPKSIYGSFPIGEHDTDDAEVERWIRGDKEGQERGRHSGLGYIVALDPETWKTDAAATMFGFTVTRLPRDANRWGKQGTVSDYCVYDGMPVPVATTMDDESPKLQFIRRTRS